MNNFEYVIPSIKQLDSLKKVGEFLEESSFAFSLGSDDAIKNIDDLFNIPKNIVIGEPGIGKTELLHQLEKKISKQEFESLFVELRQFSNYTKEINEFVSSPSDKKKILFLDGFDEVSAKNLEEAFSFLQLLSEKDIYIYASCRKSFADKYKDKIPSVFRFIAIAPLTRNQLYIELIKKNYKKEKVEDLLSRLFSFGHNQIVLQIPRYFVLFLTYLENKGIDQISEISRNDLFQEFINEKLKIEDARKNTDEQILKLRVLEKLALVMEIYQNNNITEDEFVTFLDTLKSDIKDIAFSQMGIASFLENSILKRDPIHKTIYFENTEFQEYLAAKEISRFKDPIKTISSLATSNTENSSEIFPSWLNTFVFFSEFFPKSSLFVIEYAGINAERKVVDDSFFKYISRIDSRLISESDKKEIFKSVFEYFQRNQLWLPSATAIALPEYFFDEHLKILHYYAEKSFTQNTEERIVQLGNLAYAVGGLIERDKIIEQEELNYWRKKLLSYVADPNDNGVLQRHALYALGEIKDSAIINELPDLSHSDDELVAREFIEICSQLDPNHPKTISYIISAMKSDERIQAHSALYEIKEIGALKFLLKSLIEDDLFFKKFVRDYSIFKEDDIKIVNNFEFIFDDDINAQLKILFVKCLSREYIWNFSGSHFLVALMKLLYKKNDNFFEEMIPIIHASNENIFYSIEDLFVEILEVESVPTFIKAFESIGDKNLATHIFQRLRWKEDAKSKSVYEAGRSFFPNEYKTWEQPQKTVRFPKDDAQKTYKSFLHELEPEKGQFMHSVFKTFTREYKKIESLITNEDKDRLKKLIFDTIFKFIEPSKCAVTITSEHNGARSFSIDSSMVYFRDAIAAAKLLELPIDEFRQKLINFIPFAHYEALKDIFDLVGNITDAEIAPLMKIYSEKGGVDLWRYEPASFIRAVQKYNLKSAAPILKNFVDEEIYDISTRTQAIEALSKISADKSYLQQIFEKYINIEGVTKLGETANTLLITDYEDKSAVKWRIAEILKRCGPFKKKRGVHSVGDFEHEIEFGNEFAKPLMELKGKQFVDEYLALLKESFEIWGKGSGYHSYTQYIWNIIEAYFQGLKEHRDFKPLQLLEQETLKLKDLPGANWFSTRIPLLRRQYLEVIEKPQNISQAVDKYNKAKEKEQAPVTSVDDLFEIINLVIEEDIRNWVEGDGAYKLITEGKLLEGKLQPYEKLIQKTIQGQLELCLLRKGVEVAVNREPENMDGKKVDLIIRHGFIGPVIIEIKLTTNSDLKLASSSLNTSKSYANMEKYMLAHGAKHGIFLVMKNDEIKQGKLDSIQSVYGTIRGVNVKILDCTYESQKKPSAKAPKPDKKKKKATKK